MLSPQTRWKIDRALKRLREKWSDFRTPSAPRPQVCFNCKRLVGASESVCSHCGANQSKASFSALKRVSISVLPAENPVTYALLFANLLFMILIFVGSQQVGSAPFDVDGRILRNLGAKLSERIFRDGEYWRLVMPIFLHGGLWHFGFNSYVLWQVGPQVEDLFGSKRFFFLYMATGVFGFAASTVWYPTGFSVGASGSIFGLIGVLISYISQKSGFSREYRTSLIQWALFMLVLGLIIPHVDNAAHVGGLAAGLLLGRTVSDRRARSPGAQIRLWLMTWTAAIVLVWSLAMVLLRWPLPPAG